MASIESWTEEFKQCLKKIIQGATSHMYGYRPETRAERTYGLNDLSPTNSLCVDWTLHSVTGLVCILFGWGGKQIYMGGLKDFYEENNLKHWNL